MNTQLYTNRLPRTAKTLPPMRRASRPSTSPFDPVAYAAALEVLG